MLFCTFLRLRYTTTTWNFLISRARFTEKANTTQKLSLSFLNLDNDRYGPKENFAKICQIK